MVHTRNLSSEETQPRGVQILLHFGFLGKEKKGNVTSSSDKSKNRLQTFPSHPTPEMYLRNHGSVLTLATSSPHSVVCTHTS